MEPTNPTVQTPAPPAETSMEKPKDPHGITIAAMALFVLLALGAVAFLYYQNQQLKGLLASYQTVQSSPAPTATPNVTANWITFTDKAGQFTFKYPNDFKPTTPEQPYFSLSTPIAAFVSNQSDLQAFNYTQESFLEFSSQNNLPVSKCFSSNDPTKEINGTIFYIQTPPGGVGAGNTYTRKIYRTGTNSKCFEIASTIHSSSDYNNIDLQKVSQSISDAQSRIDQIISTFQFLPTGSPSATPIQRTSSPSAVPNVTY